MNRRALLILLLLGLALTFSQAGPPPGAAQIRAMAGGSELVITTTPRLAGAIGSLRWGGKEFIDAADHGRELQSASSFDNTPAAGAETFNPTEAGSRDDGAGPNSTSRLLELTAGKDWLRTRTQMAFWLAPGESSAGQPARNRTRLSDYRLTKEVHIGVGQWKQALDYQVTFTLPARSAHTNAQFEALTGYMPEEFSQFWQFNPSTHKLERLSDGPGEINHPVVLATPDGRFAMGIYGVSGRGKLTYGRWKFAGARVVKWNCVMRVRSAQPIPPGDYVCRMRVPLGTLADVQAMLGEWEP